MKIDATRKVLFYNKIYWFQYVWFVKFKYTLRKPVKEAMTLIIYDYRLQRTVANITFW